MKEKKNQSDYLSAYKCNYCDGTHCTQCKHKEIKEPIKIDDVKLYEEPRLR